VTVRRPIFDRSFTTGLLAGFHRKQFATCRTIFRELDYGKNVHTDNQTDFGQLRMINTTRISTPVPAKIAIYGPYLSRFWLASMKSTKRSLYFCPKNCTNKVASLIKNFIHFEYAINVMHNKRNLHFDQQNMME
jgi:hypothetical protein